MHLCPELQLRDATGFWVIPRTAASGISVSQIVLPVPRNWEEEYTRDVQWPPSHPSSFLVIIPHITPRNGLRVQPTPDLAKDSNKEK